MNHDWHDLIQRYIAGTLSDDEALALQNALKSDADLRALYLDYMNLDVALGSHAESRAAVNEILASPIAGETKRPTRWLSWRPLAAAAAGIVFGMLCTSVVFGFGVVRSLERVVSLFQESFESGPAPLVTGVPIEAGRWSGDYSGVVGEQQGVKSATGKRMLRFLSADYEGKSHEGPSRTASVWRLVDLRPYRREFADGGAVAQLSAVLNAQAFPQGRSYFEFVQIHALDAAMTAALKERHWTELNTSSLALTRSAGVELDRDPATWQRIDCEQRLPGNADFLLIEIGLKQMPKTNESAEFDGHFLDDVRLTVGRRPLLP